MVSKTHLSPRLLHWSQRGFSAEHFCVVVSEWQTVTVQITYQLFGSAHQTSVSSSQRLDYRRVNIIPQSVTPRHSPLVCRLGPEDGLTPLISLEDALVDDEVALLGVDLDEAEGGCLDGSERLRSLAVGHYERETGFCGYENEQDGKLGNSHERKDRHDDMRGCLSV